MAAPINHVPFGDVPVGASLAEREKLFKAWERRFAAANPLYLHSDGTSRGLVNRLFGKRR